VKPRLITEIEADAYHMEQTLTGDAVDGYKGCPGVGPANAARIIGYALVGTPEEKQRWTMWAGVLRAFEAKKLTLEDALVQARVARICRHTDYDYQRKEVKLWEPPANLTCLAP
jgi:DNA polymerase-1